MVAAMLLLSPGCHADRSESVTAVGEQSVGAKEIIASDYGVPSISDLRVRDSGIRVFEVVRKDGATYIDAIDYKGDRLWSRKASEDGGLGTFVIVSDNAVVVRPGIMGTANLPHPLPKGSQFEDNAAKNWYERFRIKCYDLTSGEELWDSPEGTVGLPLAVVGTELWTHRLTNARDVYAGKDGLWQVEHRDCRTGALLRAWHVDHAEWWTFRFRYSVVTHEDAIELVCTDTRRNESIQLPRNLYYDLSLEVLFQVTDGKRHELTAVQD